MKRVLFISAILLAVSTACETKYRSSIPDYEVYLELNFNDRDQALKNELYAYKIYTLGTAGLTAVERTGYGGIIVYRGIGGTSGTMLYAYDLACPYEADRKNLIQVDEDKMHATCPKCQSKYDLSGGFRVSGPCNENLKRYNVLGNDNDSKRLVTLY